MKPITKEIVLLFGLLLVIGASGLGYGSDASPSISAAPYQDDPNVVKKIAALGSRSALCLPPFKVDAKSSI
jgi:hypothetical protein